MICTRCEGSGFLNICQVPDHLVDQDVEVILDWALRNSGHDVTVCDCCGDGEEWYGLPGEHKYDQGWDTPDSPSCI
jgi:hypothetical protein